MSDEKEKKKPHRFLPGNPGGPGRPKGATFAVSDYSRNLTKSAVISALSTMLDATEDEIKEIMASRETPALRKAIASVILACIENGDYMRLEMLLNRTIGKVKDESVIETKNFDEKLEKVPKEKIVQLLRTVNS